MLSHGVSVSKVDAGELARVASLGPERGEGYTGETKFLTHKNQISVVSKNRGWETPY